MAVDWYRRTHEVRSSAVTDKQMNRNSVWPQLQCCKLHGQIRCMYTQSVSRRKTINKKHEYRTEPFDGLSEISIQFNSKQELTVIPIID